MPFSGLPFEIGLNVKRGTLTHEGFGDSLKKDVGGYKEGWDTKGNRENIRRRSRHKKEDTEHTQKKRDRLVVGVKTSRP